MIVGSIVEKNPLVSGVGTELSGGGGSSGGGMIPALARDEPSLFFLRQFLQGFVKIFEPAGFCGL